MSEKHINEFRVFDSVSDFLDVVDKETKHDSQGKDRQASSWTADKSWKETFKLSRTGDLSAVDDANAILEKVDASVVSSGLRPQWVSAPCGAFPNVPAYLANAPESMFRKENERGVKKSVNIYYVPAVSASIEHTEIFKRGVTVLALAMQLSRICSVNIYFATCYGTQDHIIRLATPMVLSESAHVLTSTAFLRNLSYGLAHAHGWFGSWARWHKNNDADHNIKEIKKRLELSDDDIVIPPMHKEEWDSGQLNDPVKYINEMLEKYKS
jgi:hypothetical protein